MYQQNLRSFFSDADKVTCHTNKATQSKTKKLTFSLTAMKFSSITSHCSGKEPTLFPGEGNGGGGGEVDRTRENGRNLAYNEVL